MSTAGVAGRPIGGQAGPGVDANTAVRGAFLALARAARHGRTRPGALVPARVTGTAREAWIEGMTDALTEVPVLHLVVQPGALLLGDTAVLDGAERAVAETLHLAGARSLTVFSGVGEDELVALGSLLLVAWGDARQGATSLESAVWGADLPHVHVDFATSPATMAPPVHPSWMALAASLEAPPALPTRLGPLSADALATLRGLHDGVVPEPASLGEAHAPAPLPPELVAEAAVNRVGADLDPTELGGALKAGLAVAAGPARVGALGQALIAAAVELLGSAFDSGPLLHGALELLDPGLAPSFTGRDALRASFRRLAHDPLRASLHARLPPTEAPDLKGPLFSLLCALDAQAELDRLAEGLPPWALRVLADSALLHEGEAGPVHPDRIRVRLASPSPTTVLIGLAMAARLEDARLLEPVLALADHRSPEVRENVLFALRQQRSGRVLELIRKRLEDPAEPVRIEALRYCVAYRLADAGAWVEARLQDPALASATDTEVRALCIAYGRLLRDRAEPPLLELATSRRRGPHPALPRFALHGLRAIGTPRGRAALDHVALEVPRLRDEATALLAGDGR